jgi:hypothetical protein
MGSVWLSLRADVRLRWRVWLALAVLLGLVGGIALPAVLAAVPVTLLLANTVAAGPGWAAARIRPASVLRNE